MPNCGKPLKLSSTKCDVKASHGREMNSEGNNLEDIWAIRSQASKCVFTYEEGSETRWHWVLKRVRGNPHPFTQGLKYSSIPYANISKERVQIVQYHEVKLNIEFREVTDCYWAGTSTDSGATWTAAPSAVRPTNFTASLFVDYIYLDTDERRRFAQSSHEYLIEQLQFTGDESIPSGTTSWKSKLNFNHPVKELVWVVQKDTLVDSSLDTSSTLLRPGKQWFNWSDTAEGEKIALGSGVFALKSSLPVGQNPLVAAKLQLNGHDRFSERSARYFNLVQPFQHHENVPGAGIYVYSFGLKPEEHQPSGTCNMSRIDNATLQFTLKSGLGASRIKVFAVNYNVNKCVEKLHAVINRALIMGKQLDPRVGKAKAFVASECFRPPPKGGSPSIRNITGCGEILRALATIVVMLKRTTRPRLIAVELSKNARDWMIRRRPSNLAIARVRWRLRDWKVMGPRRLATFL